MVLINVLLDLIGQVCLWLVYVVELEGVGCNEDQLVFLCDVYQFYNLLLVELFNGSYVDMLVCQFFFDVWYYFLFEGFCESSDVCIVEIVQKCFKEVIYYVCCSIDLMICLGDGSEESYYCMQDVIDVLWMYIGELFIIDVLDYVMQVEGIVLDFVEFQQKWQQYVIEVMCEVILQLFVFGLWMQSGGKQG